MKQKFTLINTTKTTLGPASLISYLCKKKIYNKYIYAPKHDDSLYTKKELALFLKEIKSCPIVGFSSFSISEKRTLQLMKSIKNKYKNKLLILGGPNVIMDPLRLIKKKQVDSICTFEGELPLESLINFYPNKKYLKTPGLWFKKRGKIIKNNYGCALQDIDQVPFINFKRNPFCEFKKLENEKFIKEKTVAERIENPCMQGNFLYVMASRGCPYSCSYCINHKLNAIHKKTKGKIIRMRTNQKLIQDLKKVISHEDKIDNLFFFDDDFFIRTEKELEEFSKEYKKQIGIPFFIFANPNSTTKKKIDLCYKAGLIKVEYGLQTVSKDILKRYNRQDGTKKLIEIINHVNKKNYKMEVAFDIITNSPFEKNKDVLENIKFVLSLKGNFILYVHNLHLFPGSKLRKDHGKATGNEFKEYQNNLVGEKVHNEYLTKLLIAMQGSHRKNNPEKYGSLNRKEILKFLKKKNKSNLGTLNKKITQTEVAQFYAQQYCSNKEKDLDVEHEC
jgi:radical SAM superfamily enzyme YgiQ (UPF0313 family)